MCIDFIFSLLRLRLVEFCLTTRVGQIMGSKKKRFNQRVREEIKTLVSVLAPGWLMIIAFILLNFLQTLSP